MAKHAWLLVSESKPAKEVIRLTRGFAHRSFDLWQSIHGNVCWTRITLACERKTDGSHLKHTEGSPRIPTKALSSTSAGPGAPSWVSKAPAPRSNPLLATFRPKKAPMGGWVDWLVGWSSLGSQSSMWTSQTWSFCFPTIKEVDSGLPQKESSLKQPSDRQPPCLWEEGYSKNDLAWLCLRVGLYQIVLWSGWYR